MLKKALKVGEILVCLKKPTGNPPHYPSLLFDPLNPILVHILSIRIAYCKKGYNMLYKMILQFIFEQL